MTALSRNDAHLDEHVDGRVLLQVEGHLHLGGRRARIVEEALPTKHLHRNQPCSVSSKAGIVEHCSNSLQCRQGKSKRQVEKMILPAQHAVLTGKAQQAADCMAAHLLSK